MDFQKRKNKEKAISIITNCFFKTKLREEL